MQALIRYAKRLSGKQKYYQVDSYFPSSKLCIYCGNKTEKT